MQVESYTFSFFSFELLILLSTVGASLITFCLHQFFLRTDACQSWAFILLKCCQHFMFQSVFIFLLHFPIWLHWLLMSSFADANIIRWHCVHFFSLCRWLVFLSVETLKIFFLCSIFYHFTMTYLWLSIFFFFLWLSIFSKLLQSGPLHFKSPFTFEKFFFLWLFFLSH